MIINQLFRYMPDRNFLIKLLNIYGIRDFSDHFYFIRNDLIELNTLDNIIEIKDELENYYIPCKAKTYLNDLTLKRCIVILRQFLKCHNYNLYSKEKFIKGVKHTIYYIGHESDKNIVPMRKEKIVISFD